MAFGTGKVFETFEERAPVLSVGQKMRATFYGMAEKFWQNDKRPWC